MLGDEVLGDEALGGEALGDEVLSGEALGDKVLTGAALGDEALGKSWGTQAVSTNHKHAIEIRPAFSSTLSAPS